MAASEDKPRQRFLSLKWRVSLLIISVLLVVSGVVNVLAFRNLEAQFNDQAARAVEEYSAALLAQSRQRVIELGESMLLNAESSAGLSLTEQLVRNLDDNWEMYQISWGMENGVLLNARNRIEGEWGEFVFDGELARFAKRVRDQARPDTILYCLEQCRLYAGLPLMAGPGETGVFMLGTSLADFIISFAQNSDFDLALLRQQDNGQVLEDRSLWSFALAAVTNSGTTLTRLNRLQQAVSADEFFRDGVVLDDGAGQYHYFYALELQQGRQPGRNYIVLIADVSAQRAVMFRSMNDMGLISLLGLAVTVAALLLVLWQPLARLTRLAGYFPMLMHKDYDGVRASLHRYHQSVGPANELDVLEEATEVLTNELEHKDHEIATYTRELEEMALYDALTGLANRRLFNVRLADLVKRARRSGEAFALAFVDLDKFKPVNDLLGHEAGDELLKVIAGRLEDGVRETDTVARMGGDEFAILFSGVRDKSCVSDILDKLLVTLRMPVLLGEYEASIDASVGITLEWSGDTSEAELIRRADKAMYAAKNAGGAAYRFCARLH